MEASECLITYAVLSLDDLVECLKILLGPKNKVTISKVYILAWDLIFLLIHHVRVFIVNIGVLFLLCHPCI